jgi:hypothetical protein
MIGSLFSCPSFSLLLFIRYFGRPTACSESRSAAPCCDLAGSSVRVQYSFRPARLASHPNLINPSIDPPMAARVRTCEKIV